MSDYQSTTEHYRAIIAEIRDVAQRAASAEIRAELLELAERYNRLAARGKQKPPAA